MKHKHKSRMVNDLALSVISFFSGMGPTGIYHRPQPADTHREEAWAARQVGQLAATVTREQAEELSPVA